MKINEKDMLLIEDFLEGSVTGEQLSAFNDRLQNDLEFKKAVEFRKKLPELMHEAANYDAVRNEVKDAIASQKRSLPVYNKNWILAAAATVLILIGFVAVLRFMSTSGENQSDIMVKNTPTEELMIDEPVNYGAVRIADPVVELVSPLESKSIEQETDLHFSWNTQDIGWAHLYVQAKGPEDFIMQFDVKLDKKEFIIENHQLKHGNYIWYINDSTSYGRFVVR